MTINFDQRPAFDAWTRELPLPLASACADVLRASGAAALVEATAKASEQLARYLAAAAISAYRFRGVASAAPPPLAGNLSFGHFVDVIKRITKVDLANGLSARLRAARGAVDLLDRLANFRNRAVGHAVGALTDGAAYALIQDADPVGLLTEALRRAIPITELPLVVVSGQTTRMGKRTAQLLLLLGDNPRPTPVQAALADHVLWPEQVYLVDGIDGYRLPPLLVWCLSPASAGARPFYLDAVERDGSWRLVTGGGEQYRIIPSGQIRYNAGPTAGWESLRMPELVTEAIGESPTDVLNAYPTPPERLALIAPGADLHTLWNAQRPRVTSRTPIPWEHFEAAALRQWVSLAAPAAIDAGLDGSPAEVSTESIRAVLESKLLDGRAEIEDSEVFQLVLLFGSPSAVHQAVGRALVSLRWQGPEVETDVQSVACGGNILETLRRTVDFVRRSPNLQSMSEAHLAKRDGDADYAAMREAIVNLLIHQDYRDASGAAEIVLASDEATFLNPGHSLVAIPDMMRGMRSQPRNGLVAEALRLMGFAELRASGVVTMLQAWDRARRVPPVITSDPEKNRFRISFGWRYGDQPGLVSITRPSDS